MYTQRDKHHVFLGFLVLKEHLDQCELVSHLAADEPGRKEKAKDMKATNHQRAGPTPWAGSFYPSHPHRRQTDRCCRSRCQSLSESEVLVSPAQIPT